ncbi:MAG: adenylate/guanylate cyclase domain-containing protein [Alphaproteobacteria bacterium]
MANERVERRLAAILAGDVAGYSRLMGVDEEGTLRDLKEHRASFLHPKVAEHRGRIVKTTGDGVLIEFPSVVDAVRCAVEMQRGMAERNADVPAVRRIELRMGINLGDIIIDDDDIYGDGVNVAARLEALADPGGICISRVVRDQVRDKLDFGFGDMGEQSVKNIARPVRVYRVEPNVAAGATLPAATVPMPGPAMSERPSIAVLPFQNMSNDSEQEYFVDGIVEDIITGLSRIKWLLVVARNSTFTYKGKSVDVKQVGRDLGVRYVLEGSLRKAGNQLRITTQLIEAGTGTHVWAERYDRPLGDVFELQDEITLSVVGAIEPSLRQAEIERAKRKRPGSLDAYDLYLHASPFAQVAMPGDADKALALLNQALALQPDYAAAHALAAWCYEQRYLRGGLHDADKVAGLRHARAAIESGADDALTLATAGFVIGLVAHDYETAMNAIDNALKLTGSSALALSFGAVILGHAGQSTRAIEYGERAIRLSPADFMLYMPYTGLATAYSAAGNFAEAAAAGAKAAQANPRFSYPQVLRAAALTNLGRLDDAKAVARRVLELEPNFTVGEFVRAHTGRAEIWNPIGEALRHTGLPA